METKIANLEDATAAKMTNYEHELDIIVSMITKDIDKWKNTQLQRARQAIDKILETRKAEKASWKENLDMSDLQSMMAVCKEAEAERSSATDISLPKINLEEMLSQLNFLCDTIQTLPATPSNPKDTNEN